MDEITNDVQLSFMEEAAVGQAVEDKNQSARFVPELDIRLQPVSIGLKEMAKTDTRILSTPTSKIKCKLLMQPQLMLVTLRGT